MKTYVLWIDALSSLDINQKITPYLYYLSRKYNLGEVTPVLGYNSIAAAFFTGYYPEETNQFTVFCKLEDSLEKQFFLKILPPPYSSYPQNLIQYYKNEKFLTYYPKYEHIRFFNLAQKGFYHQQNAIDKKTIFNYLDNNQNPYYCLKWPLFIYPKFKNGLYRTRDKLLLFNNNDYELTKYFIKNINKNKADVFFHTLGSLDNIAHFNKRNSLKFQTHLKYIDNCVKLFVSKIDLKRDNFMIWSDHGMVGIKQYVNILKELPINGDGINYFIDSTIARFWFHNFKKKKYIMDNLSLYNQGRWLNKEDMIKYRIRFSDSRFGNEMFLLNEGSVFSPNFYDKGTDYVGMHGYSGATKEEKGTLIINKSFKKYCTTVDLFATLAKLCQLPSVPSQGQALI